MVSVRTSVEPLNTALGQSSTIALNASFVGLPIINQALAAENPLNGGTFFVTVRTLIKVLEATPIDSVLKALAEEKAPHPPPPPPPPPPPASPPTITASTEGAGFTTVLTVKGTGFLSNKMVTVRVADEQLDPERNFQQRSTPSGELLSMKIPLPCNTGGSFHVSATDSRPGPGILGVVFSNNVTLRCP
jgi:hypothetical protein